MLTTNDERFTQTPFQTEGVASEVELQVDFNSCRRIIKRDLFCHLLLLLLGFKLFEWNTTTVVNIIEQVDQIIVMILLFRVDRQLSIMCFETKR